MITVKARKKLYKRADPSRRNAPIGIVHAGTLLEVEGPLAGEKVEGVADWYRDRSNAYYWGGAIVKTKPQSSLTVNPGFGLVDYNHSISLIPEEWKKTKGKGVKVAILDTGVYRDHQDLSPHFINDAFLLDFSNSRSGYDDVTGHGTHVAGIIGGRGRFTGIFGIAPESEIYILKVSNDSEGILPEYVEDAMNWILAQNIDVVNLSFKIKKDEYQKLIPLVEGLAKKNTIMVAAAGDDVFLQTGNVLYPAASPHIIGIGAVSQEFINQTSELNFHPGVDFIFPLAEVNSCYLNPVKYKKDRGSSMATAFVTGIVCLQIAALRTRPTLESVRSSLSSCSVFYQMNLSLNKLFLIKYK